MVILVLFYIVTDHGGLADILKWIVDLRKLFAQGGRPPEGTGVVTPAQSSDYLILIQSSLATLGPGFFHSVGISEVR